VRADGFDQVGGRVENVLAVIENQHSRPRHEDGLDAGSWKRICTCAHCIGDNRVHLGITRGAGQVHEADTHRHLAGNGSSQTRLADTGRTNERHQAPRTESGGDRRHLHRSADERSSPHRGPGRQRAGADDHSAARTKNRVNQPPHAFRFGKPPQHHESLIQHRAIGGH
jgi:hypothetical protein